MLEAHNNDLGSYPKGEVRETKSGCRMARLDKCLRITTPPNGSASSKDVQCPGGYPGNAR